MKFNYLKISNINSLKGDFEIDFNSEPVASSNLIAIVGPTGSGKSTILDCITLALYNKTPRGLIGKKDEINRNGSIVNRYSNDASIILDFEHNNEHLRGVWKAQRGRRGEAKYRINNIEHNLLKIAAPKSDDQKSFIDKVNEKSIEEYLGLTYEQFLKSVMLSQGDFAKFITANSSERSDLLSKVTQSFDFSAISTAVYQKYKVLKDKADELQSKLSEHTTLDTDALQTLENEKIKLSDEFKNIENELSKILTQKNNIEQYFSLLDKNKNYQIDLDNKKKQLELRHEDIDLLDKFNLLEPLSESLLSLRDSKKEKDIKLTKLESVEKLLHDEQLNLSRYNEEQKLVSEKLKKHISEAESLEKLWSDIDILDKTIDQIKTRLQQKDTECESITDDIKLFKNNLSINKTGLKETNKKLTDTENWLTQNIIINDLIRDYSLILEQNIRVKEQKKQLSNSFKSISYITVKTQLTESKKEDFPIALESLTKDNNTSLQTLKNTLKFNIDADACVKQKEKLTSLDFKFNEELANKKLIEDTQKELTELNQKLEGKKKEDKLIEQKISFCEKQRDKFNSDLAFIRLKESKEAESFRNLLVNNQECPVCGSLEHPWASHKKDDNKLRLAEQNKADAEQKLQDVQRQSSKTNNDIEHLNTRINELGKNINLYKLNIANTQKEIIQRKSELISPLKNNTKYKESIQLIENELKVLKDIEKLEKLKTELEDVALLYHTAKRSIDDFEKLVKPYDAYVDTEEIINVLTSIKQEFEHHIRSKSELKIKLTELEKSINTNDEHLRLKKTALQTCTDSIEKVNAELDKHNKKRSSSFTNKVVNEERTLYLNEKTKLNTDINKINNQINLSNERIKTQSVEKDNLQKDITELSDNIQKLNNIIIPEIQKHKFEHAEDALLFLSDKEKFKHIDNEIIDLKNDINNLISLITNTKENAVSLVSNYKDKLPDIKDITIEQNKLIEHKEILNNNLHGKDGIITKLDRHYMATKRQGELLKQMKRHNASMSVWEKLNDLIGSSNGNKFNKYAQSLILQTLYNYTNDHLEAMKSRYRFSLQEIKAQNDNVEKMNEKMYVIDMEMGNEQRSVTTLSGGETFMLSLCMALGLSDMSRSKVKIENLFIDEGFGALDKETLDEVLVTLELLQAQTGKKIIIISHVEELKNKVHTQIQLSKQSSGSTSLEIVG